MTRMVDTSDKKDLHRMAIARGRIYLQPETLNQIQNKTIKKGDPFPVAEIASILAAKNTPTIIPLCHQIPLTDIATEFAIKENYLEVTVTIKAVAKTGVEMEALVAVCAALTNIWDMTKYIEKDKAGQYPTTRISDIQILRKEKFEDTV